MKILDGTKTSQGHEIILYGVKEDKHQILIVGVIHGDEPQGGELINRYLHENTVDGVLFIPVLNPDGLRARVRVNSNGVDINRNFPCANWQKSIKDDYFGGDYPASEIETRFLISIIEKYEPKLVITLHAPYKIVNYDGDAKDIAAKISAITGYPLQSDIGYPTPGSFGTYAGIERDIPTITLELDEHDSIENIYPKFKKITEMFSFI